MNDFQSCRAVLVDGPWWKWNRTLDDRNKYYRVIPTQYGYSQLRVTLKSALNERLR